MPSSTQAGSSSKRPIQHEWTSEQTYNLLDLILSNPKYTQNLFPTPDHTPAPGVLQRYARTICMIILKDTAWMEGMNEHFEGGKLKFDRRWVGDDPVTTRLKELPEMARHYEERLGGHMRYEDIPLGSEYAKRWRKYERCPERKWVLKYFALKRIQADNSMMANPESLLEVAPSTSTPASVKERQVEAGRQGSTSKNGSGSKKRNSIRPDDPTLASKRRRSNVIEPETATSSLVRATDPNKEKVIIVISDSEEDDIIPIPRSRQKRRVPSPTFVGSDSDSESESDIRSVSPPIITLPSRSFALPPPDSPFRGTIPSPVRLAFQKPIDDTPTDSESENEDINPAPHTGMGMGMGMGVFSTISLTTNEDLVGMFTDPNLVPQQAWRNGLPTPPDSRGSGSTSPVKSGGRGWDSALTPEPEMGVRLGSREDMDVEFDLDNDNPEELESDRPTTPPLPPPESRLVRQEYPNITPSRRAKPSTPSDSNLDHPMTPPLPTHYVEQSTRPQPVPDKFEIGVIDHEPTEAEREIAARLLRTLTGDQQPHEGITTLSEQPQLSVQEETSSGVLADWIVSHTESSPAIPQGITAVKKGRERRPLLDRMAPGISKGKGKEVDTPMDRNSQVHATSIEGWSYSASPTKTSSTSATQPEPGPSVTTPMDATSIHKATFQISTSILNLLIAQTHLTSPLHLSGHIIALAAGHIPFRTKLGELIIALGGVVLEEIQVRGLRGRRYIVHPIGEGGGGMVDGLEGVDVLGFLEIVGAKIQGSA